MKYDELVSDQPDIEPPPVATKLGAEWLMEGVVVLEKFMPDDLIDAYCEAHERSGLGQDAMDATPYMRVPELLDFLTYQPLSSVLQEIIGKPMSVHLNLTGWLSTERDFHQDAYLSPPEVRYYYAAVWFALEDIDPDSGVFQYIPRSHNWPLLDADKVIEASGSSRADPSWPKHSEAVLTPLIEQKIRDEGLEVRSFVPKRGTILIWHSKLMHRGSKPAIPGLRRKALIAHYSSVHHRPDFQPAVKHGGGWYFPFT